MHGVHLRFFVHEGERHGRELAARLLERVAAEKLELVYSISEAGFGVTGRG